ncbi:MAG TPA: hypothetical protein VGB94_15200 [Acidobacteriaceae bacterium]
MVLAVLAVFWLPSLVPVTPSASVSYIYGFNNHVALLALLLVIAIGAIWTRGLNLMPIKSDSAKDFSARPLWIVLFLTLLLCEFFSAFYHGGQETGYFINRIQLLAAGHRPYLDFEFIYGPLLIYPPLWIARLFHVSVARGFFIYWTLNWFIGICQIYWIIRWIGFAERRRLQAFIFLSLCCFPALFLLGLNYTPMRMTGAIFCVLATTTLAASGKRLITYAAAVAMVALLFGISAESGIAYAVTMAIYMGLGLPRYWRDRSYTVGYLLMLCGFAGFYMLASRIHEMDTMKQFSAGAESLPLILGPFTLLYLAGAFIGACYAWSCLLRSQWQDTRLAAVILAMVLLPGALGRCDPGHIFTYEMGALLTVMVIASYSNRAWRWGAPVIFLLLVLLPILGTLWNARPGLHTALVNVLFGGERGNSALSRTVASVVVTHRGPAALLHQTERLEAIRMDPSEAFPGATPILQAPFGYSGADFYYSPRVDTGYYVPVDDVMSGHQATRKITELQEHPDRDLLIPRDVKPDAGCAVDPEAAHRLVASVFGYNYFHHVRNIPPGMQPLCRYIVDHYRYSRPAAASRNSYVLWEPISTTPKVTQ